MIARTLPKIEAIKFGWETTKENFLLLLGSVVGIYVIMFVVMIIVALISSTIQAILGAESWTAFGIIIIVNLLRQALNMTVFFGILKVFLKCVDKEKPVLNDIFMKPPLFLKSFLGAALYALIITACFVFLIPPMLLWFVSIMPPVSTISLENINIRNSQLNVELLQKILKIIGTFQEKCSVIDPKIMLIGAIIFFLLSIPVVYLSFKYMFYPFLIIDKGISPIAAFKESAKLTKENMWQLTWFFLLLFGFLLIFLVPAPIAMLLTIIKAANAGVRPDIGIVLTIMILLMLHLALFFLGAMTSWLATTYIYRSMVEPSPKGSEMGNVIMEAKTIN